MITANSTHIGPDGFYHCHGGGFSSSWDRQCEPKPPSGMGRTNGHPTPSIGFRTNLNHRMPAR